MLKLTTLATATALAAVLFAGCSNEPKRAERNMDKTTPWVAENVDNLHAGEAIYASIAVGDVGSSSKIKAVWLGPEGVRIYDETKDVAAGVAFLAFQAPSTHAWAPGDYKVEVYLGDELASSESFDIVLRNPA